jgi:signal transduction histidine kinase
MVKSPLVLARAFHRMVVKPYASQPYSIRARMNLFLILLESLVPVTLLILIPPAVINGSWLYLAFAAGLEAIYAGCLALLARGRRRTAVLAMVFGATSLILVALFVLPTPHLRADPLLVSRLGLFAAVNLVIVVLVDERNWVLCAVAAVYLLSGVLQLVLVQLPLPETNPALLAIPYTSYFLVVMLILFLLVQIQRITRQSIKVAVDASADLERLVVERTEGLERALEALHASQQKLNESEKLSIAGRLVAEVAHEINTPLAAIHSSNESIRASVEFVLTHMTEVLTSLDPGRLQVFLEVLNSSHTDMDQRSSTAQRQARSEHQKFFEAAGLGPSRELAEVFTELGLPAGSPAWLPFLARPNALEVLELARNIVIVQRSSVIIDSATDKAGRFVQSLLQFLRGETNNPEWEDLDVAQNLEHALFLMKHSLKSHRVTRIFENVDTVRGVATRLIQVWTNLIRNALQAMNANGELILRVRPSALGVVVEVEDDGHGIPADVAPKIFEPFFSTKPSRAGSGLGLGIVRSLVEEHGGRVDFASAPGKTVFSVELPRSDEHTSVRTS